LIRDVIIGGSFMWYMHEADSVDSVWYYDADEDHRG